MSSPLLADAFGHHVWATIRVLDASAALDDPQLATAVPGTYGSIIDTLRHLVDGDVFYLNVLRGGDPEPFDKAASEISTMRAAMEAHDAAWQCLTPAICDPTTVVVEYEGSGYETHAPLGIRLAQALYHGTDHRSQGACLPSNRPDRPNHPPEPPAQPGAGSSSCCHRHGEPTRRVGAYPRLLSGRPRGAARVVLGSRRRD